MEEGVVFLISVPLSLATLSFGRNKGRGEDSYPLFTAVSLFVASVTCNHHCPKTLNGKFQKYTIHIAILSSMMKAHAASLSPTGDVNHPFAQRSPLTSSHIVIVSLYHFPSSQEGKVQYS